MTKKEKLRPIYAELCAYLLQAPGGDVVPRIYDPYVWRHYNATIDDLNSVSGRCYDRFKVTELHEVIDDTPCLDVTQYRQKLAGLINRLHTEYFGTEESPFKSDPGMIINQTQQQNQSVHIQMIMEITEELTRNEARFKEGSKERSFIDKVKHCLKTGASGITSMAQLVLLICNIANQSGLTIEDVHRVFRG